MCSNLQVFSTQGSKKTVCCVSSHQTHSSKHLHQPSAVSHEALPGSIKYYYLLLKIWQQTHQNNQFISHKIPKLNVQFLNIWLDFIPSTMALFNYWHIIFLKVDYLISNFKLPFKKTCSIFPYKMSMIRIKNEGLYNRISYHLKYLSAALYFSYNPPNEVIFTKSEIYWKNGIFLKIIQEKVWFLLVGIVRGRVTSITNSSHVTPLPPHNTMWFSFWHLHL